MKGRKTFMQGTLWHPSKGSNINVWMARWIHNSPSLRNSIEGPLHPLDYKFSLQDLINGDSWNLSKIAFDLPNVQIDKIKATPTPTYLKGKDYTIWDMSSSSSLTTKSCYKLLEGNHSTEPLNKLDFNWI